MRGDLSGRGLVLYLLKMCLCYLDKVSVSNFESTRTPKIVCSVSNILFKSWILCNITKI